MAEEDASCKLIEAGDLNHQMDEYDNVLCCGCLCAGRKMVLVEEFWRKQCFLQIIGEISVSKPENLPLLLCWECEALTHRFTRFKKKVQSSYERLNEFSKQNLNLLQIQQEPVLKHHFQYIIDISQEVCTKTDRKLDETLQESDWIGTEDPTVSDDSNGAGSDNDLLTEYHNEVTKEIDVAPVYTKKVLSSSDQECVVKPKSSKKKSKIKEQLKQKSSGKKQAPTSSEPEVFIELRLSRAEIEREREEARGRDDYIHAVYKCERCIISFPNPDDLKDHTELKHQLHIGEFTCQICEVSFAREVSHAYHTNKHCKRYACAACGERFPSKRKAARHHELSHVTGKLHKCETCGDEFANPQKLAAHQATHPAGAGVEAEADAIAPAFPCPSCDKRFRWATSLRKHQETHRIMKGLRRKPYCDTCSMSFSNTANLQKHVKTSSKHQIQLKLRKLPQAQTLAGDHGAKETRAQRVEQIKTAVRLANSTHQCPLCERTFQWRGNLARHLHSHRARASGELVCKPCDRTFSSIATYNQHMKISRKHVDESEFKHECDDCGKRFANKIQLSDHINWEHLKNYVHTCADCQKVFKSHTSLHLHQQVVHKKDKSAHLCDHCGKACPNRTKLRDHIAALHTAEARYKCSTCGAKFNWHSCLSRHIRVVHRQDRKPRRARVD